MYDRDDKTFGRAIQISAFVYSLISNTNAPNTVILYTTVHDYHGAFVHLVVTQDPQKQKGKEKKKCWPWSQGHVKILRQIFLFPYCLLSGSERKINLQINYSLVAHKSHKYKNSI